MDCMSSRNTRDCGVTATIGDKGWAKVSAIQGILGKVDMASRWLEVGLILRKAILVGSPLSHLQKEQTLGILRQCFF